jgi:hypothetical protein
MNFISGHTNYYQVLGVSETASSTEIRTAYRRSIRQTHPDLLQQKGVTEQQMGGERARILNEAYSVLYDSKRRARYDSWLRVVRNSNTVEEPEPPQTAESPSEQRRNFWRRQLGQRVEYIRIRMAQLQQYVSDYDARFATIGKMNTEVRRRIYRHGTIAFSSTFVITILATIFLTFRFLASNIFSPLILLGPGVLAILVCMICDTLIFTWAWKSPGVSDNHDPNILTSLIAKNAGIWISFGLLYLIGIFSCAPIGYIFAIAGHAVAINFFMKTVEIPQLQEEIDRIDLLRYRIKQHQAEIERLNMIIGSL